MIGVVADDGAEEVLAAVAAAGGTAEPGDAPAVLAADPEAVVAVGERAVLALVRHGVEVPVLAVGDLPGLPAVPAADLDDAVAGLVAGRYDERERRLLSVAAGDLVASALAEVMLVTTEPASISEYGVRAAGGPGDRRVGRFRADGVVAATPAGSFGYAHACGGPLLGPGTDAVAVVPVAPFSVDRDRWVLPPPVSLVVEREEVEVSILVDGRDLGPVPGGVPVALERGGTATFAAVAASRPAFGPADA